MAQVLYATTNFENIHSTKYVTGWDQDLDFSKSGPKEADLTLIENVVLG
jgi:hypothetical protein